MLKVSDPARLGASTLNLNVQSHQVMPPEKTQWEKAVLCAVNNALTSKDVFSFERPQVSYGCSLSDIFHERNA